MRIAFCGASGTGKTALAEFLAAELSLPLNPVGSRTVAKGLGFDNPYDVDKASLTAYESWLTDERVGAETEQNQRNGAVRWALANFNPDEPSCRTLFQEALLEQKITWELAHDAFVTDRTTVDNFVYSALHNVGGITNRYLSVADQHIERYDVIFFTPIASFHNLANDPNRVAEFAYHRTFELFCDGTLVNWLGNDWNEKVQFVTHIPLEARKAYVLNWVKDHS